MRNKTTMKIKRNPPVAVLTKLNEKTFFNGQQVRNSHRFCYDPSYLWMDVYYIAEKQGVFVEYETNYTGRIIRMGDPFK